MKYTFYVVTNTNGTGFLDEGTGNSEYDGPMIVKSVREATFFDSAECALSRFTGKGVEYTKEYWGEAALARFLKHAIVKPVRVEIV